MKTFANMFSIALVTALFAVPVTARAELSTSENSTLEDTPIGSEPILEPDPCDTEPAICDDGESGDFEPEWVMGVGAAAGEIIYTHQVSGEGLTTIVAGWMYRRDLKKWQDDCAAKGGTLKIKNYGTEGAYYYRIYSDTECVKN